MLEDLKTLYEIFKGYDDQKKSLQFIHSAIIAEAKFNNDLSSLICRSNPNKVAENCPGLFGQFATNTYELLSLTDVSIHKVLKDKERSTEKQIEEVGKGKPAFKKYLQKTPSALYEFYIRKARLLKALHEGEALLSVKVSLNQRCRNLEYATRALIGKLELV